MGKTKFVFLKKKINSKHYFFPSKTQENADEYIQKLKYFLKTQGKNSFFRQVHYPALLKLGQKENPEEQFTPLTTNMEGSGVY